MQNKCRIITSILSLKIDEETPYLKKGINEQYFFRTILEKIKLVN
jgi:hypothetical protein